MLNYIISFLCTCKWGLIMENVCSTLDYKLCNVINYMVVLMGIIPTGNKIWIAKIEYIKFID